VYTSLPSGSRNENQQPEYSEFDFAFNITWADFIEALQQGLPDIGTEFAWATPEAWQGNLVEDRIDGTKLRKRETIRCYDETREEPSL